MDKNSSDSLKVISLILVSAAHLAGAGEYTNSINIKQFYSEAPVLELWGMLSIPWLPLLPDPLWHGVVAPDRVLSMNQIELFDI